MGKITVKSWRSIMLLTKSAFKDTIYSQ